ncbi:MAG: hypothetical protein IJC98_03305 [Clostridia bacterium]|nr:hypothetical protein [Clostridia bacterium]
MRYYNPKPYKSQVFFTICSGFPFESGLALKIFQEEREERGRKEAFDLAGKRNTVLKRESFY